MARGGGLLAPSSTVGPASTSDDNEEIQSALVLTRHHGHGVAHPILSDLSCKPSYISTESYALVILVVSSMFYSVMAAFIKLAKEIPPTELVFLRAIFQGILVIIAMIFVRDPTTENRLIWQPFGAPNIRRVVVARGIVGGFGFLLYYYTISVLPLGDATTLLSLSPILTVFAGSVFLKEQVRASHFVAALGSLVGCMLIAKPSFLFGESPSTAYATSGYVAALMGACCGAAVYVLIRRAGKGGVHTLQLLCVWVFFGTIFSFLAGVAFPVLTGRGDPFIWPSSQEVWMNVLGVCSFGSMGHLLMNYAARHATAGLASIMRSSGILWSFSLEICLFGQVPHALTIWGALLIVVSLATIAIEKQRDTIRNSNKGTQEDGVSPSRPKSTPPPSVLSTVDNSSSTYRYGAINI